MLAYIGRPKRSTDLLLKFQQLSLFGNSLDGKGHQDGWGFGYYPPPSRPSHDSYPSPDSYPSRPHLVKKAECAFSSSIYMDTIHRIEAVSPHVVLVHLRKASPRTKITIHETHPFLHENVLFCHNGTIFSSDDRPLGPTLDSIQLFEKIQEYSLEEAVPIFWNYQYTSLCCILTDGHTIWGYRDFMRDEKYYTLYYHVSDSCVILCSEPLFPGDWKLLKNRELITVSHDFKIHSRILSSESPASRVP